MIWQGVELLGAPDLLAQILPVLLLELPKELLVSILIHDLDLEGIHVALHGSQAVAIIIIQTGELPLP
jgi:hypothetical protein